jgi:hypothetical protein
VVDGRTDRLIGGAVLDDSVWNKASDARVAKLQIGKAAGASWSAVPLAGKWLLSARHCLFAPEPKSGATRYEDGTPNEVP